MASITSQIRDERGTTLLELLLGIGILVSALTMVASPSASVLRQDGDWRADITAINTLQSTANWVAKDIVNATSISLVDGAGATNTMTLGWTDLASAAHTSVYSLDSTNLVRTFDGTALVIGRGVTVAEFSLSGQIVTFSMTLDAASGTTDSKTSTHLLRVLP